MTSTDPNRYYMWTGYTGNDGVGGGPVITNAEAGYDWTTYPERLEAAKVSWKIYQDAGDGLDGPGSWGWTNDAFIGNYGDTSLLYFDNYRNAKPGDALYDKARTGTNAKSGQNYFDILRADVASGNLPQISYIVAPEAFSEHPNWPVNYGAWYIAQALDALTSNPEVWSKTALFITYDENDGFFDHVVPPFPAASAAQGGSTTDVSGELFAGDGSHVPGQYGLGVRVPMIVVSPWSKGGWLNSQTFDHTSIIQFMERRFGVHEPNISPWRRAVCGDLTSAFYFGRTETKIPALPSTAGYVAPDHDRHNSFPITLPSSIPMPKQEPGSRPARPLPYDLSVEGRVSGGKLRLDFASHGPVGAGYYVTSSTDANGPWTYTVGAGRNISGSWDVTGAYDYTVHGPNGFLREFKGTVGKGAPEVSVRRDATDEEIRLVLVNEGTETVHLTITNGYGNERQAIVRLRPEEQAVHTAHIRHSHGWYDLSVVSDQDPAFLRRLAGHVETGKASLSDPAIITG
jgi:phospholipase C